MDLSEGFATKLKDFAYGANGYQKSGLSYLVNRDWLKHWKNDFLDDKRQPPPELEDILESTSTHFILIMCPGDF